MSVRTELEVARELKRVRKILAEIRANNGEDQRLMYGAQQTLVWVLKQGISPSELDATILAVAEELDHG